MTVEIIDAGMLVLYPLMLFAGVSLFVLTLGTIFGPSTSKIYRQDLSNMYVAGKIKQIAKKDGINLNEEFLDFSKVMKNKKINLEALDNTVERELQEKLSEDNKSKLATKE